MIAVRRSLCPITLMITLVWCACGGTAPGGSSKVNLDAVPSAKAGCEAPTQAQLVSGAEMLPGRVCEGCHVQGGQAGAPSQLWTVSGTVFGSTTSACNTGGAASVKVEILDKDGAVQDTLTTDSVGNFYTINKKITFPITAKITGLDGKVQQMFGARMTGACSTCHQNPALSGAPGRLSTTL